MGDDELGGKLEKFCSRAAKFIRRAFRPDKKCFGDHYADSITVKNAIRAKTLTDFEYHGEALFRDQWQDCDKQDRVVAQFFKLIRRGRKMTKIPSYRVEFELPTFF